MSKEKKISKSEIAKKLGVSESALRKHLNGELKCELMLLGYVPTQKFLTIEQYEFFLKETTLRIKAVQESEKLIILILVILIIIAVCLITYMHNPKYLSKIEFAKKMEMPYNHFKRLINQVHFKLMKSKTQYKRHNRTLSYFQAKTFYEAINTGESFNEFLSDISE